MKILLVGEFSGLHWTLAEGLRVLGHQVTVLSDGDGWKNYRRDISLTRFRNNAIGGSVYVLKLLKILPQLKEYDVVQLINPCFLKLRPEKSLYIYHYLRKHNKKIFLGAFGPDYYWVKTCMETDTFRYSDFKTGDVFRDTLTNRMVVQECLYGKTAVANQTIANTCNGIISCLYEYYVSYLPHFPGKTIFIPLPVNLQSITPEIRGNDDKINFFIGIQAARSDVKGTDIMYPVLKEVAKKYPEKCRITKVVSLPYEDYQKTLSSADVQLDQLYSYTPSMNSLLAMAKGIVVVGGGEKENYTLLNEKKLRPIVNVLPDENDVFLKLEKLILEKECIPELSRQSIEYVATYHEHVKVAKQYVDFWNSR